MSKPITPASYTDPYRAEDDARTLSRAGEIIGDKTRHTAAMGHLKKQVAGMQRVMGAPSKPKPPAPMKAKGASLGFAKGKR